MHHVGGQFRKFDDEKQRERGGIKILSGSNSLERNVKEKEPSSKL